MQATGAAAEKISMAGLVDQLSAAMDHPAMPPGMPQQPMMPKVDKQRLLTKLSQEVLSAVKVGNVRLDGVTVGVSERYWTQWGVRRCLSCVGNIVAGGDGGVERVGGGGWSDGDGREWGGWSGDTGAATQGHRRWRRREDADGHR